MHGDRGPYNIPALDTRDWGGGYLHTGQPNELWSYGEENYLIMKKYYNLRISMHNYIKKLYEEAHTNGSPLMRTLTSTGEKFVGEQSVCVDAPIEYMPVFEKASTMNNN